MQAVLGAARVVGLAWPQQRPVAHSALRTARSLAAGPPPGRPRRRRSTKGRRPLACSRAAARAAAAAAARARAAAAARAKAAAAARGSSPR
eukprot:scaffold131572_cov69-Phaeocystis_antarctica.AAC.1